MFSKKLPKDEERELTFKIYDLRQAINKLKKDCQKLKNTPGEAFIKNIIRSLKREYGSRREKLILANARLVRYIATDFYSKIGCDTKTRLDIDDLFDEGVIGLQLAADRYNPHKVNKFSVYGVYWVRQRMHSYIQNHSSVVYVPLYIRTKIKQFKQLQLEGEGKLTDKEVEDKLEMSMEKIAHALNIIYPRCMRLDHPISEEDSSPASEMMADSRFTPESIAENREMLDKMAQTMDIFLSTLRPRELEVVHKRIGRREERKTLQEIGEEINISRERVRQIERLAWHRIKKRSLIMQGKGEVVPYPELHKIMAEQTEKKLIEFSKILFDLCREW